MDIVAFGIVVGPDPREVPIWTVTKTGLDGWLAAAPAIVGNWLRNSGFKGKPGGHVLIPGDGGALAGVVVGVEATPGLYALAGLPGVLPPGVYRIDDDLPAETAMAMALGWALGSYRFERYRKAPGDGGDALLRLPATVAAADIERLAGAVFMVRDLVNTPAGDMGPAELAAAARDVAKRYNADCTVTVGDDLLEANYPMIHAVGRASERAPRLIDLRWGDVTAPRLTLVGKGVCFDSGGLDIKPSAGMRLMKKDMGGAATVLGLARMIMDAGLKVRLRVLIPAVENSVSGASYRPGDVLRSRKGLTVEIGNTDAEGRLVLADALAEADSEVPDLLIDCATLTGAARVALGPEVVPFYTTDDALADDVLRHSRAASDPLWRMPLWEPYREMIESKVADLDNSGEAAFAGSLTAALFLKSFVERATSYVHVDLYAWSPKPRPGRPAGGEAQAMRALFGLLRERYG